jgi:hypothetical protein
MGRQIDATRAERDRFLRQCQLAAPRQFPLPVANDLISLLNPLKNDRTWNGAVGSEKFPAFLKKSSETVLHDAAPRWVEEVNTILPRVARDSRRRCALAPAPA